RPSWPADSWQRAGVGRVINERYARSSSGPRRLGHERILGARRGIARLFPFTVRNRTWTGAGRAYLPIWRRLGWPAFHARGAPNGCSGCGNSRGRRGWARGSLSVAGSAGLPVAVQDGGTRGCLRRAGRRQDVRHGPVVHGGEGEREVLDADVVVVPPLASRRECFRLFARG